MEAVWLIKEIGWQRNYARAEMQGSLSPFNTYTGVLRHSGLLCLIPYVGPVHLSVHLWNHESVCLQLVGSHLWIVIHAICSPWPFHPWVPKPYELVPFSQQSSQATQLWCSIWSLISTTRCYPFTSLPAVKKRSSIFHPGPCRCPTPDSDWT